MTTVYIVSLGCSKNLVDTEVMCGQLATSGFALTPEPELADIMLINTCGFIRAAREEARQEIGEALDWKRSREGRRVVVAGCLPQLDMDAARESFPDVDAFLGVDNAHLVADTLRQVMTRDSGQMPQDVECDSPIYLYDHRTPRLQLTPSTYVYVKIADGCDNRCAYCTIPDIRGAQRSRSPESVVEECRQHISNGAAELNFIAQDTARYGEDRQEQVTLSDLLMQVDRLPGDFWIRVLYLHPLHIDDRLIDVLAEARHVVPYLDIPLQHVNDRVLTLMGRGACGERVRKLVGKLRSRIPNAALRSTLMVGYPGEGEREFAELAAFVRDISFDRLGVFCFSPEPGTQAAALEVPAVSAEIAEKRRATLLETQQAHALARNRRLIGRTCSVLLEEVRESGTFIGRTYADAPEVDQVVEFTGPEDVLTSPFARVTVTDAAEYDLYGEWCATGDSRLRD